MLFARYSVYRLQRRFCRSEIDKEKMNYYKRSFQQGQNMGKYLGWVPILFMSSVWISPTIRNKTTSFIDDYIFSSKGMRKRELFYKQNAIYRYPLDELPKVSAFRRIGAWMFDATFFSAIPYIATMSFLLMRFYIIHSGKVRIVPGAIAGISFITMLSFGWYGRDIWFGRYGMQSLGRQMFGIYAISTNGMQYETWNTLKLNSAVAITLAMTGVAPQISGIAGKRAAQYVLMVIGTGMLFGYGYTAKQLCFDKQIWFDKISNIRVVNMKDLKLKAQYFEIQEE
eukprot:136385_1